MKKDSDQSTLIVGRNAVEEAIDRNVALEKIFINQGLRGPLEVYVRNHGKENLIPVSYVDKKKLDRMTKANHQGIIAVSCAIAYQRVEQVLPMIYEKGETPLFLMLDHITDVRNLGAIARSAEAFGVHALIVPMDKTAMVNDFAIKTSAGALLSLPVCREKSLFAAANLLIESGITLFALDMNTGNNIADLDATIPMTLVIGSEDEGISKSVYQLCEKGYSIEQGTRTESLNASVAAGIAMYACAQSRLVD